MNVLSLFDGMSCGQQALERIGIKVDNYFASEIDKYAIQVTMANYPNTVQLGSVTQVDGRSLPKIDLLIGGSPCQSFSFAGKRKGMSTKDEQEILTLEHYLQLKSEGFEFEGQSYLFWEYMRLLGEVREQNPNVLFLLENVMMGEKWEKVLSKAIGVNPIMINSSLMSAQNRQRLYWTNIGMVPGGLFGDLQSIIEQPKDKGILLKDVLEDEVDQKYFLSDKMIAGTKFTTNLNDRIVGQTSGGQKGFIFNENFQVGALCASDYKQPKQIMISQRGRDQQNIVHNTMPRSSNEYIKIDKKGSKKENQNKASCFTAGGNSGGNHSDMDLFVINNNIRRLTPTECERLQTVKDGYTNYVSDTQRYKMLGNGWTVDVIAHIFSYIGTKS